jgi:anti-sigma B factor antagonist
MTANPTSNSELTLEIVKSSDETTVRCTGRINSATSAQLQTCVRSLMPETKLIVLDLSDVNHLDSSGLGAIVGLYISAKRQQCELKLINLNQRLKELFRITKLGKIFEGHEDMLGYTPD